MDEAERERSIGKYSGRAVIMHNIARQHAGMDALRVLLRSYYLADDTDQPIEVLDDGSGSAAKPVSVLVKMLSPDEAQLLVRERARSVYGGRPLDIAVVH